jgi:hypothetical protein
MFRLLAIIILLGVVAFYTKPGPEAHETKARAVAEAPRNPEAEGAGAVLDEVVGFAKGLFAGEGRYEDFYLASHYTADLPGSDYVECWGAFAYVHCSVVEPAS